MHCLQDISLRCPIAWRHRIPFYQYCTGLVEQRVLDQAFRNLLTRVFHFGLFFLLGYFHQYQGQSSHFYPRFTSPFFMYMNLQVSTECLVPPIALFVLGVIEQAKFFLKVQRCGPRLQYPQPSQNQVPLEGPALPHAWQVCQNTTPVSRSLTLECLR